MITFRWRVFTSPAGRQHISPWTLPLQKHAFMVSRRYSTSIRLLSMPSRPRHAFVADFRFRRFHAPHRASSRHDPSFPTTCRSMMMMSRGRPTARGGGRLYVAPLDTLFPEDSLSMAASCHDIIRHMPVHDGAASPRDMMMMEKCRFRRREPV